MSLLYRLKHVAERLPPSVGTSLARLPFSLRLGPAYAAYRRRIAMFEQLGAAEAQAWVLSRLRAVSTHAAAHVPFYRELYGAAGISPKEIATLADFRRLPVVTKADLLAADPEARRHGKGLSVNTGGTSGQPLLFDVEGNAFAREWAHMHHLWYARGYRPQHLKLTLRGKHFHPDRALVYNAAHNELVANANAPISAIVAAAVAWRGPVIRWVHGYPSLVAEFATALSGHEGHARFRAGLHGVLLGSEYPAPNYRTPIEQALSVNILSWYGHSEMAVLAGEGAEGVYMSLPTYGFAEALPTEDPERFRLVCTSFDNVVHPFIRYDTGDIVAPVSEGPEGLAFRVLDGRIGDFVQDRQGERHALTAIIFGRHHAAFGQILHVQLAEMAPGDIRLLITPRDSGADAATIRSGFDFSGLDMDWRVQLVPAPIRSAGGKIKLKVEPSDLPSNEPSRDPVDGKHSQSVRAGEVD